MTTVAFAKESANVTSSDATVFIVDDDNEVRRSLSLLMRSVGIKVETFSSAQQFQENYKGDQPGCLVLDVRMPGLSGLELQKALKLQKLRIPIIFISAFGEIPMVTQTLRAGALDFLQKPYSSQVLLERIHEAFLRSFDDRRTRCEQNELETRLARLSDREREIMYLLAEGVTTKTIAARLGISPKTVDNHRAKIFEKLQVENAAQVAALASKQRRDRTPSVGSVEEDPFVFSAPRG